MDKAREIELLTELKTDSYFVEEVGIATIEKMIQNVRNDLSIFLGTEYTERWNKALDDMNKKVIDLNTELVKKQQSIDALEQNAKIELKNIAYTVVKKACKDYIFNEGSDLYNYICDTYGISLIIKVKLENDSVLSDEEKQYIVKHLLNDQI